MKARLTVPESNRLPGPTGGIIEVLMRKDSRPTGTAYGVIAALLGLAIGVTAASGAPTRWYTADQVQRGRELLGQIESKLSAKF